MLPGNKAFKVNVAVNNSFPAAEPNISVEIYAYNNTISGIIRQESYPSFLLEAKNIFRSSRHHS